MISSKFNSVKIESLCIVPDIDTVWQIIQETQRILKDKTKDDPSLGYLILEQCLITSIDEGVRFAASEIPETKTRLKERRENEWLYVDKDELKPLVERILNERLKSKEFKSFLKKRGTSVKPEHFAMFTTIFTGFEYGYFKLLDASFLVDFILDSEKEEKREVVKSVIDSLVSKAIK